MSRSNVLRVQVALARVAELVGRRFACAGLRLACSPASLSLLLLTVGCSRAEPPAPLMSGCVYDCESTDDMASPVDAVIPDSATVDSAVEFLDRSPPSAPDAQAVVNAPADADADAADVAPSDVPFLGRALVMDGACFLGQTGFDGSASAWVVDGSGATRTLAVDHGRFQTTCRRGDVVIGLKQPGVESRLYPTLMTTEPQAPETETEVVGVDRATLQSVLQVLGRPADPSLAYGVVRFSSASVPVAGVTVSLLNGGDVYYCSDGVYYAADATHATSAAGTALLVEMPAPEFPGSKVKAQIGGVVAPREISLRVARGFVTVVKEVLP